MKEWLVNRVVFTYWFFAIGQIVVIVAGFHLLKWLSQ